MKVTVLIISTLVDELAKMSKPIDDSCVCHQLIRKMPEQFQLIIQFLLQLSDAEFKYKNLVSILLDEEPRLTLHDAKYLQLSSPVVQMTSKAPLSNFSF